MSYLRSLRLHQKRGERGQVLVITALAGTLLLGMAALAINIGGQSNENRNLANWSDASVISGVRACSTACNAKTQVQDAIQVILQNSPWSATATWASSAPTGGCTASSCVVTNYAGPAGFTNYLVSVSSPPATPRNSAYNTTNYVEAEITHTLPTSFTGMMGVNSVTAKSHSVVFDSGPQGPYQFAFFSRNETDSGNQQESIIGDAFLGNGYQAQSSGKAGLCMYELPGPEPAGDADGDAPPYTKDNDADDQGHAVFGVVPPTVGPKPFYGLNPGAGFTTSACPGKGDLNVEAPNPQTNCPAGTTSTFGGGVWMCLLSNPAVPNIPPPVATQPLLACASTLDKNSSPGVYPVRSNCTVTLDFSKGNIQCISLLLNDGSAVNVDNKKGSDWITSYGYSPTSSATAAMNAVSSPAQAAACAGAGIPADRSVIWAPNTAASPPNGPTALSNSLTGCCSTTLFVGTIFLPGQQVSFNSNQALEDVGSIYCQNWNVQSGNHPNPVVTYDAGQISPLVSHLHLVE